MATTKPRITVTLTERQHEVLRTISDLLFVFDLEPLWQPLFQGFILLAAVSLGSLQLLKVSNRLDLFK